MESSFSHSDVIRKNHSLILIKSSKERIRLVDDIIHDLFSSFPWNKTNLFDKISHSSDSDSLKKTLIHTSMIIECTSFGNRQKKRKRKNIKNPSSRYFLTIPWNNITVFRFFFFFPFFFCSSSIYLSNYSSLVVRE